MIGKEQLKNEYKNRNPHGHWFDKSTMEFFRSRIGAVKVKGDDWFFITSEKDDSLDRMFTVRKMDINGQITNVSDFYSLSSYKAKKLLNEVSAAGPRIVI